MPEANPSSVLEILFGGAAGGALVLIVNVWLSWRQKNKRVRGHWEALYAEVLECGAAAGVYVTDLVAAPLYRLPTVIYQASLPALLADAGINENEATALIKFYSQVEALNRGIDFAQAQRDHATQWQQEAQRNRDKASTIRSPEGRLYEAAIEICRKRKAEPGVALLKTPMQTTK